MKSLFGLYYRSFAGLSPSIWLLSLVTLINRSGAMVLPFLSVYLSQHLGFSLGQTGLIMMTFGLGSIVGSYLGGQLTDRFGYYPVQLWSLIGGGILFIGLDFVDSFYELMAYIFILSIAAESYRPASMVAIAVYSRPENTVRSFGLLRFAINLGFSLGPALGGLIAGSLGYSWLFWIDGLTCIIAGLLFRFTLAPKKEPKQTPSEEVIPKETSSESVYKNHRYLFFLLICMMVSVVFMQFSSVLPVFFKEELLLSEATIGLVIASNGMLIAIFEMPLVYHYEGRRSLLQSYLIGVVFIGICYAFFLFLPALLWTAILAIVALTIGEMLAFPFGNTYAVQQSNPDTRGQYMALYTISFSVAHVISPILGFQIADHWGYDTLWIVLIGLSTLCVLGLWYLQQWNRRLKASDLSTTP